MAQFDVYKNPGRTSKKYFPFLVDIQNKCISDLSTRIVVPLGKKEAFSNEAMSRLTPEITYAGEILLLMTPQISSVQSNILKNAIESVAHVRDEIISAIDFAITGI